MHVIYSNLAFLYVLIETNRCYFHRKAMSTQYCNDPKQTYTGHQTITERQSLCDSQQSFHARVSVEYSD